GRGDRKATNWNAGENKLTIAIGHGRAVEGESHRFVDELQGLRSADVNDHIRLWHTASAQDRAGNGAGGAQENVGVGGLSCGNIGEGHAKQRGLPLNNRYFSDDAETAGSFAR